eukprot:3933077-Rhodomonas_salina.2
MIAQRPFHVLDAILHAFVELSLKDLHLCSGTIRLVVAELNVLFVSEGQDGVHVEEGGPDVLFCIHLFALCERVPTPVLLLEVQQGLRVRKRQPRCARTFTHNTVQGRAGKARRNCRIQ